MRSGGRCVSGMRGCDGVLYRRQEAGGFWSSNDFFEKPQQQTSHFLRRFLLNPVAFAIDDGGATEVRAIGLRSGIKIRPGNERSHRVERAPDEVARLLDFELGQLQP